MEKIPTWVAVVALALFDAEGRLLLQQRLSHKRHGGCWEFPGGKVETGENLRQALARELAEELLLKLNPELFSPAFFAEETGEPAIVLNLYTSSQPVPHPVGLEGQQWGWFSLDQARRLLLAPMDRILLSRLAA